MIRCISLPENRTGDKQPKEERGRQARGKGKGAAASVQTITKKMVGMSTGQCFFANPPTFTQRTRVGRDGDAGRGT